MRRLNAFTICFLIVINIILVIDIKIRLNATDDTRTINNMLEKAREEVKHSTLNYNFSQPGVHRLEDLVMETGGQPQRIIIISTFRSGSTFLGELLYHAVPSTFYFFEPLFSVRNQGKNILGFVIRMLQCNFEGVEDYLAARLQNMRYERQWENCKNEDKIDLCLKPEVASQLCQLFPFLNMKLVRLRLRFIEELMDDKTLNMKVVLLVRDPRGVMQSRLEATPCSFIPHCLHPTSLCDDMVSDFDAAIRILRLYPDRLIVIRFEELILDPYTTSEQILKFLKLHKTPELDSFLQMYASAEFGDAFSTFKVSQNKPYRWQIRLRFRYIRRVQRHCEDAIHLWGYKMAQNVTHMKSKDFNPVGDLQNLTVMDHLLNKQRKKNPLPAPGSHNIKINSKQISNKT